jgi:hypothetical protein
LSEIGNIANKYSTSEFSDKWLLCKPGAEGSAPEYLHETSCWWNEYGNSRHALTARGGGSFRIYEKGNKYRGVIPLARVWWIPYENGLILFNSYGVNPIEQWVTILEATYNQTLYTQRVDRLHLSRTYVNNQMGLYVSEINESVDDNIDLGRMTEQQSRRFQEANIQKNNDIVRCEITDGYVMVDDAKLVDLGNGRRQWAWKYALDKAKYCPITDKLLKVRDIMFVTTPDGEIEVHRDARYHNSVKLVLGVGGERYWVLEKDIDEMGVWQYENEWFMPDSPTVLDILTGEHIPSHHSRILIYQHPDASNRNKIRYTSTMTLSNLGIYGWSDTSIADLVFKVKLEDRSIRILPSDVEYCRIFAEVWNESAF